MKKIIILSLLPLLTFAQLSSKKIKVLFVGNSYTYFNNFPQLVHELAKAKGDTLLYDSSAPGGYTFNNHANDVTTKAKISSPGWDYVVLQAQSQEPSFSPAQVAAQTLPYALILDSLVKHHNPCATTVFFETWGRKNGDALNCQNYPPVCTYIGMQNRLRESYTLFADTTKALMAPVGEAFRQSIASNPGLELYQPDQSHPSLEGSYLAAAVFYEVLFQKSVLSNTYLAGISPSVAVFLQQVAHQMASDSIALTNIPEYIPKASFTFTAQGSGAFQFQSSFPNFSHAWNFGDGQVSNLVNPSHVYTNPGSYQVTLTTYNAPDCKKDSVTATLTVSLPTGIAHYAGSHVKLYPNPCNNILHLDFGNELISENVRINVFNLAGQLVLSADDVVSLSLDSLPSGFYTLRASDNFKQFQACFVKNE